MLYRKWVFGDEKKFTKKMAPPPNWEKICRICTNEDLDSILIFSEEGKKLFLEAKIKKYLYITILTDDNLPKMICSHCTKRLENIHRFASMALKTQDNLRAMIEPKPAIIEKVRTENSILHSILSKGLDPDLEITEVEVKVDPMLFLCAFEEDDEKSDVSSSSPHRINSTEKFSDSELDDEEDSDEEESFDSSQISPFVGPSSQILLNGSIPLSMPITNSVTISPQQPTTTNTPPQSPEQKIHSLFDDDHIEEPKEHQLNSFCCSVCPKKFSSEIHLQNHLWIHLPRGKRFWDISEINPQESEDASFAARSLLQSNSPPALHFVCPICGKKISTKGNLKVHLETHRPKGKYACDICGRVFKTQSNLVRHKDYHGGVQFPCGVCGRVYPTNSTLRAHSITHSDLRPHACPLCDKTFKRNQDLKFHINQHTGARPYQCPYCPKAFASSGNCFSHRKRMHPQEVERDREMASQIAR